MYSLKLPRCNNNDGIINYDSNGINNNTSVVRLLLDCTSIINLHKNSINNNNKGQKKGFIAWFPLSSLLDCITEVNFIHNNSAKNQNDKVDFVTARISNLDILINTNTFHSLYYQQRQCEHGESSIESIKLYQTQQ